MARPPPPYRPVADGPEADMRRRFLLRCTPPTHPRPAILSCDPWPRVSPMRRRDLITLLGGAAATWPLAAWAQQAERMRRIGIIQPASSDDPEYQIRVGALLQELRQLGWTIGRNIRIETRWTKFDPEETRDRKSVV